MLTRSPRVLGTHRCSRLLRSRTSHTRLRGMVLPCLAVLVLVTGCRTPVTTPQPRVEVVPVERKAAIPEPSERRTPRPARKDTEKKTEAEKPAKPILRPVLLPELVAEREIRDVLDGEAHKLSAAQREAVTSELVRAQRDLGLEPLFVLAIITQESRFRPRAVGPAGSLGLMQLRPFVAKDVAKRHGLRFAGRGTLFDPGANVRLGTIFLSELIDRFGNPDHAIAAYNAGPTRVGRLLDRGHRPPQRFVNKVRAHYETLRERYSIEATGWGG